MSNQDPAEIAGVIGILLLSLSWHEAAHAWVADRLGDPTARSLGRVTLNPLKHLDPFLSVVLPLMLYMAGAPIVGGGKPVPINPANFRNKARDFMLVALAGPGSNLVLALGFCLLYLVAAGAGLTGYEMPNPYGAASFLPPTMLSPDPDSLLENWLILGVLMNLLLATFNMIPVPPLDGSRVVAWLLPSGLQRRWYSLDRIGIVLVLVLVYFMHGSDVLFGAVEQVFVFLARHVDDLVLRLTT